MKVNSAAGQDTQMSTPKKKGYQTPQGLNKAMKKVQEVLSESPSKAVQTIQGLANCYKVKLEDKMNAQIRPFRALDPETIRLVKDFYLRTDSVYHQTKIIPSNLLEVNTFQDISSGDCIKASTTTVNNHLKFN